MHNIHIRQDTYSYIFKNQTMQYQHLKVLLKDAGCMYISISIYTQKIYHQHPISFSLIKLKVIKKVVEVYIMFYNTKNEKNKNTKIK